MMTTPPPIRKDLEIDGDEYTLVPLDDETFQVFRTADLVQISQPAVEPQDKTRSHVDQDKSHCRASDDKTGLIESLSNPSSSDADPRQNREIPTRLYVGSVPSFFEGAGSCKPASVRRGRPNAFLASMGDSRDNIGSGPKKKKTRRENDAKDPVVFACKSCDATFSNEFSLDAHIQQHLIWNEKPSNGDLVDAPSKEDAFDESKANLIVLEGEYDPIAGRGLFQCGICGKSFRNVGYIHIHLDKCHDIGSDQRVIQRHGEYYKYYEDPLKGDEEKESRVSGEQTVDANKHQCDKCHRSFAQHDQLLAHKSIHFQTFKCAFCGKTYTAKKSLQNHALTAHSKYKKTLDYAHIFTGRSPR